MASLTYRRRPVTDQDLEWLVTLRTLTMVPHLEASGYVFDDADNTARVTQDYDSIQVIQHAGRDVGMLKVLRSSEVWQLIQIQIHPDHQSLGLGGRVLDDLIKEAFEHGKSLSLSVLKVNPAQRLYLRHGFVVESESEGAYQMILNMPTDLSR
ncbi:MAG: GNAT family N-acetyltransferase [Pseudomonadota bacterium]